MRLRHMTEDSVTAVKRVMVSALLAIAVSACIVQSSDDRAEAFEFAPVPVDRQEAVEVFREQFLAAPAILDEDSLTPIGKIDTSAGPMVWAEFQTIDPQIGRQQCAGHAGPRGSGWGCGPIGQEVPDDFQLPPITLSASGSSGTWSDVEMRVNDDVVFLEAVAQDGTTYRMEPIAGFAWMEWKSERGELVITAFDRDGEAIGSVETDAT